MTDVTPLRAAKAPCLPDREGREVVVVPVVLLRLQAERVEAHLLLQRAERNDAERLRLAAREKRRAVGPGRDADLDRDVANLVLATAVGTLLVHRDPLTDDRLLQLVEDELRRLTLCRVVLGLGIAGVALEHRGLDRFSRVLAGELVLDLRCVVERLAVRGANLFEQARIGLGHDHFELRLAALLGQLTLERAELLDLAVGDVERVEDLRLGDLARAGLDHQDRVLGAGDDQIEVARPEQVLLARVDDEVAVDLADPHRADRSRQRDVGDHQRR